MELRFVETVPPDLVAALRESVGWPRMEKACRDDKLQNFFELGCYDGQRLVGYVCVVSNRVTDAYIQDLMVAPDYQGHGIGTALMQKAVAQIRNSGIYMISVIYGEESLRPFYEKLGFTTMLCGQMETRAAE